MLDDAGGGEDAVVFLVAWPLAIALFTCTPVESVEFSLLCRRASSGILFWGCGEGLSDGSNTGEKLGLLGDDEAELAGAGLRVKRAAWAAYPGSGKCSERGRREDAEASLSSK